MIVKQYSYRYAIEILQHPNYKKSWDELYEVIKETPIFIWPGKSSKNKNLDVVQQMINVYFDRRLSVDLKWDFHPLATAIKNSGLAADFRKKFLSEVDEESIDKKTGEITKYTPSLTIQAEVQFGNASRFYSDIFKFQTAYSQSLANIGVCVLPSSALAKRIDSNVASFERAVKELPSAELSITLPIVLFGLEIDENTKIIDLSQTKFKNLKDIISSGNSKNKWRIINAIVEGHNLSDVGPDSDTGPMLDESPDEDL